PADGGKRGSIYMFTLGVVPEAVNGGDGALPGGARQGRSPAPAVQGITGPPPLPAVRSPSAPGPLLTVAPTSPPTPPGAPLAPAPRRGRCLGARACLRSGLLSARRRGGRRVRAPARRRGRGRRAAPRRHGTAAGPCLRDRAGHRRARQRRHLGRRGRRLGG